MVNMVGLVPSIMHSWSNKVVSGVLEAIIPRDLLLWMFLGLDAWSWVVDAASSGLYQSSQSRPIQISRQLWFTIRTFRRLKSTAASLTGEHSCNDDGHEPWSTKRRLSAA